MAIAGNLSVALSLNSARYRQGLDMARRRTETFAQRTQRSLRGVTRSYGALTAVLTGVTAALGTRMLLENADQLVKNADAAGIAFEQYQRLQFGFEQAGINAASFSRATVRVSQALLNAERGLATNVRQFEELGLSVEGLLQLNPDQRFIAVARAISNIEDPAERTARATELLGRQFATTALNIDAVIERGEDLNPINEEAARAAERVNDTFARLSVTFGNLAVNVLGPLLDNLVPIVENFSDFAAQHPIITQLGIAITALGVALRFLGGPVTAIITGLTALITLFNRFGAGLDDSAVPEINRTSDSMGELETQTRATAMAAMAATEAVMGTTQAVTELGDTSMMVAEVQLTAFEQTLADAMDTATRLSELGSRTFDGLTDSLTDFVTTGMANFGDFARSIIRDLIRIQIRAAASRLFSSFFGGGGFAGFFQAGGRIPSGQFGIVGEAGPEIVQGPAQVTSAADTADILGQGGSNITINVSAIDALSFTDTIQQPAFREAIAGAMDLDRRDRGFA